MVWDSGDETWLPPVVVESRPQVTDLTIDHVALSDVVSPPQRVNDFLTCDDAASVGRKQVQQALLQGAQVQFRAPGANSSFQDVYLEFADVDGGREGHPVAVRAPQDRDHSR